MKTPGYDLARQLLMALAAIGLLLLIGHVTGQLKDGSASGCSLITGIGLVIFGVITSLLVSITARLARIEARLSELEPRPPSRK